MSTAVSHPTDIATERLVIATLSATNFVIGMGAFVVIGILNPIADGLALTTPQAGWILTIYALSYAVLSPVLVSVTGRVGRRRVMTFGIALFALAALVSALSPSPGVLFAARVFAAAGAGLFTPVAAAVAAALAAPERRGRALAAVFFGLTMAQVFGVPAGSFLAYSFGWRSAFFIVAALAVPCLWLIWTRIPQGLKFQPVTLGDLGRTLRDGPVMLAVLFTSSLMGATFTLYTYLTPLLSAQMGFGRDQITLSLLFFGVAAVLGNILGGWAADRLGPMRCMMLISVAMAVILLPFSALPQPQWVLYPLIFVWSMIGWSFTASQQSRLISLAPEATSVVLALNAAAIYIGAAIGSAFGGWVLSVFGLSALGLAASLGCVLAFVHLLVSRRLSG